MFTNDDYEDLIIKDYRSSKQLESEKLGDTPIIDELEELMKKSPLEEHTSLFNTSNSL